MKQRSRRKLVQYRPLIQVDDPSGFLAAMTPAQRTAWVTRLLRKLIKKESK